MKTFIRKAVVGLQVLVMASVFVFAGMTFDNQVEYSKTLNTEIVSLNDTIVDNKEYYTDTIIKIVENVKMTDSYLFTGGYSDSDTESDFNLKSYEDLLLLNNNFTELLNSTENFFDDRSDFYNDLPNIWPLFNSNSIAVSSGFGERFNPFNSERLASNPHEGIDLVTNWGDPVIATADGFVEHHWINDWKMGRYVIMKHKNNIRTYYAHMSKVIVHENQWVKKGQVIGYLGNSGISTGPHLHYGVSQNGIFLDPINFLRQPAIYKES